MKYDVILERMSDNSASSAAEAAASKKSRISQADVPSFSLEKALRVPKALAENYASHPTRPIDVASARRCSRRRGRSAPCAVRLSVTA
jgi:hypothetical protein